MDNIFLYLLGFAGTGKLTIARAFARSIGAKASTITGSNNPIFGLIDPKGCRLCRMRFGPDRRGTRGRARTMATLAKPGTNFTHV
jgi:hypothetical protein